MPVRDHRRPSRALWLAAAAAALVLLVGGATLLSGRPDAPRVASGPAVAPGPAATSSPTSTRVPTTKAAAPTPERPAATPTTDAPPPTTAASAQLVGVPGGLVGSRADDARQTLEVMGLRVETVQVRSREDKGQVLATLPGAGRTLRPGQTVVLVVSRGGGGGKAEGRKQDGGSLTVPAWIVGSALDDVREELPEDLRITTVKVPSSRGEGTVVATWPGTGQALTDSQIVLVVAGAGDD